MVAGASLLGSGRAFAQYAASDVAPPDLPIEDGASLRVLRPSKFVQGDETLFLENTKKFTEQTGVEVRVDSESWEDLRPKAAVAANVGSGPDIVLGWFDDRTSIADKLVDLTDLAEYLGEKYGGWYRWPSAMGTQRGRWIAMPIGASGGRVVYRKSWVEEAGFERSRATLDDFLELCRQAEGRTVIRPGWRSATPSATPTPGATGWCGPSAARWSTSTTRSPSTARRPSRRSIRQGALRDLHPRHAVLARSDEQQGLPRGRDRPDAKRHLDLLRREELRGSGDEGAGQGHLPRAHADRPGRPPTELCLFGQLDGVQLHAVSECGQGVPALHAGEGPVRALASRPAIGYMAHPLKAYERTRSGPRTRSTSLTARRQRTFCGTAIGRARLGHRGRDRRLRRRDMVAAVCAGQRTPGGGGGRSRARAERYYNAELHEAWPGRPDHAAGGG